jgi:AbrB family looped-hinge helix DNA binding protein
MATAKMSKSGAVILPKAVRDAHGLEAGAEFEVIDGGGEITLRLVEATSEMSRKRLTIEEFLAMRVQYDGPPITDEMIHKAIDQVVTEDWQRLERQWNGDKND